MQFSIQEVDKESLLDTLKIANLAFQQEYPGDRPDRQPVHTLYGGADLFHADTCVEMGGVALKRLEQYAPDFAALGRVVQPEPDASLQLPSTEKEIAALDKKLRGMSEADRRKEKAWLPW